MRRYISRSMHGATKPRFEAICEPSLRVWVATTAPTTSWWRLVVHAVARRFPRPGIRLHGRQPAFETAPPVVAKIRKPVHKPGKLTADPMLGLFEAVVAGKLCVVEYEPDADLRDTEQVPLLEEGGIKAFIRREVLPYTPDAWVNNDATKIGYEVSFTRHFYKPQPLRTLAEISADILAIEKEAEGLLNGLLVAKAEA